MPTNIVFAIVFILFFKKQKGENRSESATKKNAKDFPNMLEDNQFMKNTDVKQDIQKKKT